MKYLILFLMMMGIMTNIRANNLIYTPEKFPDFSPVTYYFNGTFDVIQNPYWFSQQDFFKKHETLWKRVRDPHHSIKKDGGYYELFKDEVFTGRVLPNIFLHSIGGAYDTRWLTEYFTEKGYWNPKLWSFFLTFAAHIGNEALETSGKEISSHDHIADLYFFDIVGFMMASDNDIMKFFVDELGMEAWHFQPAWDFQHDNIFNAGLNYIYRPKYFKGKVRPILFSGMQNMGGISVDYGAHTISTLAGVSLTNPLKQKGRFVVGVFHENEGRLSSSVMFNNSENFRWRVQLYPPAFKDLLQVKSDIGIILAENKSDQFALGLSYNLPLGIGFISK